MSDCKKFTIKLRNDLFFQFNYWYNMV